MGKKILFLIFTAVFGIGCITLSVLAGNEDDALAIKKVVEVFYEAGVNHDIDSTMNQLSSSFSSVGQRGQMLDYSNYPSYLEESFKDVMNMSIADLKFTNLDIKNNNATLDIEFVFQGFYISTLEKFVVPIKRKVSLVKEDGSWKIMQIGMAAAESGLQPESTP